MKKIKNVKKAVKSVNIVKKISIQKQNKHIKGTKEYNQAVNNGDTKSTWKNPNEADKLTREAYEKGTPIDSKPNQKIYETGEIIGNEGQTKVKVHESKTGIHGHPNN